MQRRFAEAILHFEPLQFDKDVFDAFQSELVGAYKYHSFGNKSQLH